MAESHEGVIRVVLVDDQEIVRRGFRAALEEGGRVRVVAEGDAGPRAEAALRRHRPDVLLADVHEESGLLRLCEAARDTGTRVAVLTAAREDADLFAALRAGASGFLLKNTSQAELVHAVTALSQGHSVISPAMTALLLDRFAALLSLESTSRTVFDSLTERELEVLIGVGAGKSNQEIASELHLALATVKSHLSNIFTKLGLRNRVHAALLAKQAGLSWIGDRQQARPALLTEAA